MADLTVKGKVVWITGASSGIGEALARQLAERRCRLILSSRREGELKRVAELCSNAESVWILPLDLSRPEQMAAAAEQALALAGQIDVMIHNAGVSQRAFAADTDYDVDDVIMRTNYLGPVALTKALLPSMLARRQGHFAVVTSVLGKLGLPGRSGYCASKHALHGFFDTLRAELWKDQIQVTLILPGWVQTNISMNALTGNGGPQRKMDSGTASGVTAEYCASQIIAAVEGGKAEVNVVQPREKAAMFVRRFAPWIFRRLIRGREI